MFLLLDVGNSDIIIGLSDGRKILYKWRIVTKSIESPEDFEIIFHKLMSLNDTEHCDIYGAGISCVVPSVERVLRDFCELHKIKYFVVSDKNLNIDFQTVVYNSAEIGQDIICNVVAGKKLFKENFVVIDMGTATTFDIVGKGGLHVGEVIVAGVHSMLNGLVNDCTLLRPNEYKIMPQTSVLCTTTKDAIMSGIYFGYIGLMKEIITQINFEYKQNMHVCLTGGLSHVFVNKLPFVNTIIHELTLEGLLEILKNNLSLL